MVEQLELEVDFNSKSLRGRIKGPRYQTAGAVPLK
jgi:hypothetical protein